MRYLITVSNLSRMHVEHYQDGEFKDMLRRERVILNDALEIQVDCT